MKVKSKNQFKKIRDKKLIAPVPEPKKKIKNSFGIKLLK